MRFLDYKHRVYRFSSFCILPIFPFDKSASSANEDQFETASRTCSSHWIASLLLIPAFSATARKSSWVISPDYPLISIWCSLTQILSFLYEKVISNAGANDQKPVFCSPGKERVSAENCRQRTLAADGFSLTCCWHMSETVICCFTEGRWSLCRARQDADK